MHFPHIFYILTSMLKNKIIYGKCLEIKICHCNRIYLEIYACINKSVLSSMRYLYNLNQQYMNHRDMQITQIIKIFFVK